MFGFNLLRSRGGSKEGKDNPPMRPCPVTPSLDVTAVATVPASASTLGVEVVFQSPIVVIQLFVNFCLYQRELIYHCSLQAKSRSVIPLWGQFGPAYKAPRFQSGPGEMRSLHFDWLLRWETVSAERRCSCGDAPLGYSSSQGGHWLLIWAGSLSGELNFHWLFAQPGSRGQPGGMPNCDWLNAQPSFFSFSWISGVLVAVKRLLKTASRWRVWGQEKLLPMDEMQAAQGQRSNSSDSHKSVG